jgi:aspartokinase
MSDAETRALMFYEWRDFLCLVTSIPLGVGRRRGVFSKRGNMNVQLDTFPQKSHQPLQFIFTDEAPIYVTANVAMITIERRGMISAPEFVGKALTALASLQITLHSFTQSSSEGNFCLVIPQESAPLAVSTLMAIFEDELKASIITRITAQHHLTLLATSADLCSTLAGRGINIINLTQGAAGCISALVTTHEARCAGWL